MPPEETALALVRSALEDRESITDVALMTAAMGSEDPLQHQIDITRSLVRMIASLLEVAGGGDVEKALIIHEAIATNYAGIRKDIL